METGKKFSEYFPEYIQVNLKVAEILGESGGTRFVTDVNEAIRAHEFIKKRGYPAEPFHGLYERFETSSAGLAFEICKAIVKSVESVGDQWWAKGEVPLVGVSPVHKDRVD